MSYLSASTSVIFATGVTPGTNGGGGGAIKFSKSSNSIVNVTELMDLAPKRAIRFGSTAGTRSSQPESCDTSDMSRRA